VDFETFVSEIKNL